MNFKKYLFIDRDGTLIEEPADYQIDSLDKFKLLPHVIPALLSLKQAGYRFVMVSNQDGLGLEGYPLAQFQLIQNLLLQILETQGIQFDAIQICCHFEKDRCFCRKPQLGLVRDFLSMPELDRQQSCVIGDRPTDLLLAENMGLAGILISSKNPWPQIAATLLTQSRVATIKRHTKETKIDVHVNLDSPIATSIHTGIGFFDHMLEQLSHHSGIHTQITVQGDLQIDDHHTVEDTGIALGTALRQALGDKHNIERFGFYLPMDESSAEVTLDLSGRSYFLFEGQFTNLRVGSLATEMVPHFFRSFSESLGANLHLRLKGENTHHQVEALFKAVGRCLKQAIQRAPNNALPSTKGLL